MLRELVGLSLLAVAGLGASPAAAQMAFEAGAGVASETYRFVDPSATGMRSLSLFVVPLSARATLLGRASVEVRGAYAAGSMERADGSTASLSGVTDTEIVIGGSPLGETVRVEGIVVLPTGSAAHTREEAEVAGAVATDLLPFRLSHWGAGGGVGVSTLLARSVGGFAVGARASYFVAREFEPVEDEALAYQPGNRLQLRLAVDRTIGDAGKASLQVGVQRSTDDRANGAGLYSPGSRYQAVGSYAFRAGLGSGGIVYAGMLRREKGTFRVETFPESAEQTFVLLGGGLRVPVGAAVFVPSVDTRLLSSGEEGMEGYLVGAGFSAEIPVAGLQVGPVVRARFGNVVVGQGVESGFTGADLGFTLKFGGARR